MVKAFLAAVVGVLMAVATAGSAGIREWSEIEKVLQRPGTRQDNLLQMIYPRTDLTVRAGGMRLHPSMGLTSWITFRKKEQGGEAMGEIVLLKKQLPVVLRKLKAENLTVTGQHSRLKGVTPDVVNLYFRGKGDPLTLVWGFTPAFSATGVPMGPPENQTRKRDGSDVWKKVEDVLGVTGEVDGTTLRVALVRKEGAHEPVTLLGAGSEIHFQREGKKGMAVGTFAVTAADAAGVERSLTGRGLKVAGRYDRSFYDSRYPVAVDFSGTGDVVKLAQDVRQAWEYAGTR